MKEEICFVCGKKFNKISNFESERCCSEQCDKLYQKGINQLFEKGLTEFTSKWNFHEGLKKEIREILRKEDEKVKIGV